MKIGVKTFDNPEFLKHFKDKVDFFEIMAIRTNNYSFLKEFSLPIIIHAEHQGFNINNADKLKETINLKSIKFAINLANKTDSKKIIIHPGQIDNKTSSKEQSISFIKKIEDKRIIIENLIPTVDYIGSTPTEIKEFMNKTNKGFCLDINHAIEAAVFLKKDYKEFIKEFIKLKPVHYHIGGQIIKENKTHLPLKESDFNIKEIIKLLPKNAEITLETTTDIKNTEEDLILIKRMIDSLK